MKKSSHERARSGRSIVVVGGCLALLIAGLLIMGRPTPKVAAAITLARAAASVPRLERRAPRPSEAMPSSDPIDAPPPGARIERIEVDKTEVCAGEENFATVHAQDGSGGKDRLIIQLEGSREMGFRLPFRVDKATEGRTRRVIVHGGGAPAIAELPEVKLKDCEVSERVGIDVSIAPRSVHLFTLRARVTPTASSAGEQPFEAVSYEWSFGDGTQQTTAVPEVEHSYEGVPQRSSFSYFLMSVKVKDRSGREVSGSRSYGFPNFGFGTFVDDHQILIYSAGGSEEGAGTTEEQRIRLYHGFEGPVRLERVLSTEVMRSEKGNLETTEYDAASLLGISELVPGKSTTTKDLSSLRPHEPGRIRKLEIIGRSGSIEAKGTIILTSAAPRAEPGAEAEGEGSSLAFDSEH